MTNATEALGAIAFLRWEGCTQIERQHVQTRRAGLRGTALNEALSADTAGDKHRQLNQLTNENHRQFTKTGWLSNVEKSRYLPGGTLPVANVVSLDAVRSQPIEVGRAAWRKARGLQTNSDYAALYRSKRGTKGCASGGERQ